MTAEHIEYTDDFIRVYATESEYVKKRREKMNLPSENIGQNSPSAKAGLIGLALSGGGIRSATFNLGLLQALAEKKVLQFCDYLSTVSGGGYIGSCMTSLLADTPEASTKSEAFPLQDHREDGKERKEVGHLRASKNYLGLSKSVFNMENWSAIGLSFSGKVLMNLLPLAFLCFFVIILLRGEEYFYYKIEFMNLSVNNFLYAIAASAALWVVNIRSGVLKLSSYEAYRKYCKKIGIWMFIAVMLCGISFLFHFIYLQANDWLWERQTSSLFNFNYIVISLLITSVMILVGGQLSVYQTQNRQKYLQIIMSGALIIMLFTLPIVFLMLIYKAEVKFISADMAKYTCCREEEKHNNINVMRIERLKKKYLPQAKTDEELWKELWEHDMNYNIEHLPQNWLDELSSGWKISSEIRKECVKNKYKYQEHLNYIEDRFKVLFKKCDGKLGKMFSVLLSEGDDDISYPIKVVNRIDHDKNEVIRKNRENMIRAVIDYYPHLFYIRYIILILMIIAISLMLILAMFVNINHTSLHRFYRDRLSKTFLIRRIRKEIVPNYELLLKDIHQHYNGPYHLINATLNVPSSDNPSLKGRGADFFVFSKCYCGSESTGYRRTESYHRGKVELATAMAVSGAAASPEMGTSRNPFLAMVMTMLNYRLNIWMPNPKFDRLPRMIWWPYYLFNEMMGHGNDEDRLLNLSDGGHHENLGIYPLLRRRCRIIIASDSGADPGFGMEDFANLQCKARIDLGIEINMNLDGLRLNKDGLTRTYFAVGEIDYPDQDEKGKLIYIKASVKGDEPEHILAYRRKNPAFPHETTANQFFNEDQFESYRKLGQVIGRYMFSEKIESLYELEKFSESHIKLK